MSDPRRVIVRCRLSHCYIASPAPAQKKNKADPNEKPKYNYRTQIILAKTDKVNRVKLNNAIKQAIAKQFGAEKVAAYMKNPNFKTPMRDADAEQKEGTEFKNVVFANAKTNADGPNDFASRPGLTLKNRTRLTEITDIKREIYSGVYAYVSLTAYYFPPDFGSQGIALALNNILKDEDGERLDGSVDAMDEFADLMEEDDGLSDFEDLDNALDDGLDLGDDDLL